jgi:hypothetical protein
MTADLTALIAKLKAAPEGSRELDEAIATAIGYVRDANVEGCWFSLRGELADQINAPYELNPLPPFTTSRDAALPGEEIVKVERFTMGMGDMARPFWRAWANGSDVQVIGCGKTEPLARRAAALRAIQYERECG